MTVQSSHWLTTIQSEQMYELHESQFKKYGTNQSYLMLGFYIYWYLSFFIKNSYSLADLCKSVKCCTIRILLQQVNMCKQKDDVPDLLGISTG